MTQDLSSSDPKNTPETNGFEGESASVTPDVNNDDDLHFTDIHIKEIQVALSEEDLQTVGALLEDLSEADIAELLMKVDGDGYVTIVGRTSPYSLYDQELVTFEEGAVAYDHRDAAGFIKLNALRLRVKATRDRRNG